MQSTVRMRSTIWVSLPIWRAQPYLLAGIGFTHYDIHDVFVLTDDRTFTLATRLGGGLDLYLTQSLVINGEVSVMLTNAKTDTPWSPTGRMHYLSAQLGLIYRF